LNENNYVIFGGVAAVGVAFIYLCYLTFTSALHGLDIVKCLPITGMNYVVRKIACASKPTCEIKIEGDKFTLDVHAIVFTKTEIIYTHGNEYESKAIDGTKIKVLPHTLILTLQEVEYVTSLTMTEFSRMSDRVEGFPS
jgi:hypothetical protein